MNEVRIPWFRLKLVDLVCLADGFRGKYDDLYLDGDKGDVVVVNPKPELVDALKRAGHLGR